MHFVLCKYDTNSEKKLLPLNQGDLSRLVIKFNRTKRVERWNSRVRTQLGL